MSAWTQKIIFHDPLTINKGSVKSKNQTQELGFDPNSQTDLSESLVHYLEIRHLTLRFSMIK